MANPTPVPEVDTGPRCSTVLPCDQYTLTVMVPAGYAAMYPNAAVKFTAGWTDTTGSGKSDYDLYVFKGTPSALDGGETADAQSASSNDPEVATFGPLSDGTQIFTVIVVPYTPTGETVNVKTEFLPGAASTGGGTVSSNFGGADATAPGAPRFQNFYAPAGTTAQASSGEFNIGYNPHSGRIMVMNTGPVWRLTPPEVANPANPESCEAVWEDKSSTVTNTGLDPILWTDQKTGRTLASNSTVGANALYSYSDNDGDSWIPVGVGPPDGGADHETIGTGPLPAAQSALSTPLNQGENTLYCSQDVVGPAMCQRSLDLGMTWLAGTPAYTGQNNTCGGLHGHVHISADGTAWLPVKSCANGQEGGVTSLDGGVTWNEFDVPNTHSQAQGADPSVGLDADNTAYYCYVNNEPVAAGNPPEGHVHVQVSKDGGKTWINDVDIGKSHGIVNAVHTEAVGGSSGRAACGFVGTNVAGDYQAQAFPGVWYAFIATTTDGGQTWTTVNATPNDPVQSKTGIWQQGGSNRDRNLLDFNEITLDAKGHVLYGYSDGCVSAGCIAGTAGNDYTAYMRVARQSGGKSLLAQFDTAEPAKPKRACLSGARGPTLAHLSWKAPDNGGAPIKQYRIFRGTAPGSEKLVGKVNGSVTSFDDASASSGVSNYYYYVVAVNAKGVGAASNEVNLTVVTPPPAQSACMLPGVTVLTDAAGDTSALLGLTPTPAPPGADLLSFQLAQPYQADGLPRLYFTINTDPGQSPQPINSSWYVALRIADPVPATTYHYRAVHMTWSGLTPTFESYTPSPNNSGGVDGRFVTAGSAIPAEVVSSYPPPYNKVVIAVKAGDLGLSEGSAISGFVSGVSQNAATVTALYDQMPNDLGYTGAYTVKSNSACMP